jgi:CBS domain containing-hemolysin-like protein
MDSDPGLPVLALVALLVLHAFFASAEVAVLAFSKARLVELTEQGRRSARLIAALSENPVRLRTAAQLAAKLCGFLAVALAVVVYDPPLADWLTHVNPAWSLSLHTGIAAALITIVLALVTLMAADLLPRALAARHPELIARLAAYPLSLLAVVAAPLAHLLGHVNALLTGRAGVGSVAPPVPLVTEEQIKTLVDAGEEGGVIEEDEKEMIYSIFELGDTLAYEVMVPRVDIVALEADTSLQDALAVIVRAGHSRIPVYEDTIDNTIGILYAKDLLQYWPNLESLKLRAILRPAYYVPETKPVDELLQELQQRKVHIAVVVDEYGGLAGLVTIEDILEEIVGEIQDEYDTEEPAMEVISPDETIFDGLTDLDDVNDELGIELPTDTSDTLSGLISSSLGRVAEVGDRVTLAGVVMTVLSMHGRRIKKVRVTRLPPDRAETGDNGAGQPNAAVVIDVPPPDSPESAAFAEAR